MKALPKDISTLFEGNLEDLRVWYLDNVGDEMKMQHIGKCLAWMTHAMKPGGYTEHDVRVGFLPWCLELAICHCIIRHLGSDEEINPLASWIPDTILRDVDEIIKQYDWTSPKYDVMATLRNLDWKQTDKGTEHYTPDWLAEKICKEVIDDDYIKEQIRCSKK